MSSETALPWGSLLGLPRAGVHVARTVASALGEVDLAALVPAVNRIPALVGQAARTLDSVGGLLDDIRGVVGQVRDIADEAHDVVQRVDETRTRAEKLLDQTEQLIAPATGLEPLIRAVGDFDPELVAGLPGIAQRLAPLLDMLTSLDSAIAEDTSELVRRMPTLLAQMEDDVVPALRAMREVAGDVPRLRELVERLEPVLVDVETRVAGLPGADRLRRRGEKQMDAES